MSGLNQPVAAADTMSSMGGVIKLEHEVHGHVLPGEYVDYAVEERDKSEDVRIEVENLSEGVDIDLFVSPFGPTSRSRPRQDSYVLADLSSESTKQIDVSNSALDLTNAEKLWVSVKGYAPAEDGEAKQTSIKYILRVSLTGIGPLVSSTEEADGDSMTVDDERCDNCHQAVPKATMFLHRNFCLRNNVLCPKCDLVFQKSSSEWKNHWHCPIDPCSGTNIYSKTKHDLLYHTSASCSSCSYEASNTPTLAHHRTTTCPDKLILCQFCHLEVRQQGPEDPSSNSAEVVLSGLTPHEWTDGGRTTECHICERILRLRDIPTHMKHHDLQRHDRPKPTLCHNANCARPIDVVTKSGEVREQPSKNELGLCEACFGPLYVSTHDPDGKALKRRVERRYRTQLIFGCGHPWCYNEACKDGRVHLGLAEEGQGPTAAEVKGMIAPMLEDISGGKKTVHFCTDEETARVRNLAEVLVKEGAFHPEGYVLEWCLAALAVEQGSVNKAEAWLKNFAPTRAEMKVG